MQKPDFMVEVSARHVHLSRADMDILFGKGSELTVKRYLSQPGQFLSEERVDVVGPKRTLSGVSVLGPLRSETQVEVSMTDCFTLGVIAPVRESGKTVGTPGVKLVGPCGEVTLDSGLIVAKRHVHMRPEDAEAFGVTDKQIVSVSVDAPRPVTFGDVVVRVSPNYALAMHVDTDEGNAAGIGREGCRGCIAE